MRRLGSGVLVVVIAGMLAILVPSSAIADTIVPSPDAPRPINVLPSTVGGAAPTVGRQSWISQVLYSYARSPDFWDAVRAQNAGTATGQQITLVQQANGSFGVPATKPSVLSRVGTAGGGVLTAVSGYSLGTMIGNGTLELVGFQDAAGTVCRAAPQDSAGQFFLGLVTGNDCSGMAVFDQSLVPNNDILPALPGVRYAVNSVTNATSQQLLKVCPLASVTVSGSTFTMTCSMSVNAYGSNTNDSWQNQCINAAGQLSPSSSSANARNTIMASAGSTMTYTFTCGAGYEPYAAGSSMVTTEPTTGAAIRDGSSNRWWRTEYVAGHNVKGWVWFSGRSPAYVETPAPNPVRTLKCVVAWAGGTATGVSAQYTEDDGVLPSPNCPSAPAGLQPTSVKVFQTVNGVDTLLWEQSPTPEYGAAVDLAPECMDGTCLLDLRKGSTSCFQSPASCAGWFADPNKDTNYSCQYGTRAVDLTECTVYAPSFEPASTTTGDTLGDPVSGGAVTNPNPNAGSDPTGEGRQCFPSGWGVFNPIEWIFRPVGCALESAFVPSQARVDSALGTIRQTWEASTPGSVVNTIGTMEFVAPSGCDGITVDMSWLSVGGWSIGSFQFMQACPGDFFAGFASATKVVGYLAFTIAGVIGVTRQIGRIFGYGGVVSGSAD